MRAAYGGDALRLRREQYGQRNGVLVSGAGSAHGNGDSDADHEPDDVVRRWHWQSDQFAERERHDRERLGLDRRIGYAEQQRGRITLKYEETANFLRSLHILCLIIHC